MKILHVIPYFTTDKGGEVNVVTNMAMELKTLGHEVTIITSDFDRANNPVPAIQGVEVIFFKTIFNFKLFIFTPTMKKWIREHLSEYDIIHLHGYRTYQNVIAASVSKKLKKPVVLQPHGSYPIIVEKYFFKFLFDLVWGKEIIRESKSIIAVSESERKQLLSHSSVVTSKIIVIPNGIDGKLYEQLPHREEFRNELGISIDSKLILYVGRLHKRKGINFLIASFAEALKIRNDLCLVVSGPDQGLGFELQQMAKKLNIENKIIFTGYIDDVRKAYVACDLLVYPSVLEIFGLVPFEGLMCGTPVIVTNDCGCGEFIGKANCGIQVEYGDTVGLRNGIIKLIEDRDLAQKMIRSGQLFINNYLLWKIIINRFLGVYEDCIRNI